MYPYSTWTPPAPWMWPLPRSASWPASCTSSSAPTASTWRRSYFLSPRTCSKINFGALTYSMGCRWSRRWCSLAPAVSWPRAAPAGTMTRPARPPHPAYSPWPSLWPWWRALRFVSVRAAFLSSKFSYSPTVCVYTHTKYECFLLRLAWLSNRKTCFNDSKLYEAP